MAADETDIPAIQDSGPATEAPVGSPFADAAFHPRPRPRERLDPRAVRAWRIDGAVSFAGWLAFTLVISAVGWRLDAERYITVAPLVLAVAAGVMHIWIVPSLRWRRWRYAVTERDIDLEHGLLVVTRTLVPMTRVQQVDTRQGPILRHYGLAAVEIATAAGTQQIPALSIEVAESLRDRIAELAGVADDV